jgi:hypothetical protein
MSMTNQESCGQICQVRFRGFDSLQHLCDVALNDSGQHSIPQKHFCKVHAMWEAADA